jgi:hypothetical protein
LELIRCPTGDLDLFWGKYWIPDRNRRRVEDTESKPTNWEVAVAIEKPSLLPTKELGLGVVEFGLVLGMTHWQGLGQDELLVGELDEEGRRRQANSQHYL